MKPHDFRAWVGEMRERHGWTKTRCAKELGTTPVQIKRWETYNSPPYIDLAISAIVHDLAPWPQCAAKPAAE